MKIHCSVTFPRHRNRLTLLNILCFRFTWSVRINIETAYRTISRKLIRNIYGDTTMPVGAVSSIIIILSTACSRLEYLPV